MAPAPKWARSPTSLLATVHVCTSILAQYSSKSALVHEPCMQKPDFRLEGTQYQPIGNA